MADISKISVNGTTYDIKDAVARTSGGGAWGNITGTLSNQTDLQSALDGKVSTSGDNTLTGKLTFQNLGHDVNSTTLPSVNTYGNELYFKDIAGNNAGWITTAEYANDGGLNLYMQVRRQVNDITCNGLLGVGLTSTGVETYTVHSPSAFRDTIDAVCKSGDTMTGNLLMNTSGIRLISKSPNYTQDNIPSSGCYDGSVELQDANGTIVGIIQHFANNGSRGICISTERTVNSLSVYHGISMFIDSSGNKGVYLSGGASPWLNALGVNWIKAGTATGTNTVTVPADANEVMAIVQPGSNSARFSNSIIKSELSDIWFIGGYYASSTDYAIININVSNSNRTFQLRNVKYGNGADLKSNSKLTVYYKYN